MRLLTKMIIGINLINFIPILWYNFAIVYSANLWDPSISAGHLDDNQKVSQLSRCPQI